MNTDGISNREIPMFTPNKNVPLFSSPFVNLFQPDRFPAAGISSLLCRVAVVAARLTLAAVAALPVFGQEMGNRSLGPGDNKALINVRTSAGVYVPGPLVKVQVISPSSVSPKITELIQRALQEGLIENDPRLKLATSNPDTLISCTVLDHAVGSDVANRTRLEYRITGQKTVHDSTTGMSRTEDEYGHVNVPYRALVLEGRMTVECEVSDIKTGIVLYMDRFDAAYNEVLRDVVGGSTPPSVDDLNNVYLRLAEKAAALVVAQLSPRSSSEIARLPTGKMKAVSKLLEKDQWNEALALLGTVAPYKDPKDDAYRLYAIGVAHEALAYETPNPAQARSHLREAFANYSRAAELRPREDMFWRPKNRAELSLWQVEALVAQVEAFDEARKAGSSAAVTAPGAARQDLFRQVSSKLPPAPSVVRNATVVQWVKAGFTQDYIAASVKHAPKTQFDLSPPEVLKLRRVGVSGRIIEAMRDTDPRFRRIGFKRRTVVVMMALPLLSLIPVVLR
jgi:hypothetical protein